MILFLFIYPPHKTPHTPQNFIDNLYLYNFYRYDKNDLINIVLINDLVNILSKLYREILNKYMIYINNNFKNLNSY